MKILIFFISFFIIYLIESFIGYSFNPMDWEIVKELPNSGMNRSIFLLIVFLHISISLAMTHIISNEESENN